jgi:hypothetical protein
MCWGDCGRRLVFRTNVYGQRIAYDAEKLEISKEWVAHGHCPRNRRPKVFTEAMADFCEPFRCDFSDSDIYAVPTIRGVVWFNKLLPWTIHVCPKHREGFPEIWNYPEQEMMRRARDFGKQGEPAVICCLKKLGSGKQSDPLLHLVALKTITGAKSCELFEGNDDIKLGDLALLCGSGSEQKLLTVDSRVIFQYESSSIPEHLKPGQLNLPLDWLQNAA